MEKDHSAKMYRIWVTPCVFRKDGAPSLGSFGKSVRNVVIIPLETWTELCQKDTFLAATQFEVGSSE